ncbi:hypothetical protein BZA77DRAFT_291891 [Pyronema omphalodes]|nr:hypothetical protein BZA77DRAFT_296880 [Pyronema omphalodes]KAI5817962.1 hypothetical protein BZA77DRAFT_291891 [Pyronema omphalodes]
MSLSRCPTEVLDHIVRYLGGAEKATRQRDLLNLRLVNRGFRSLVQPVIFESVKIPRGNNVKRSVTMDVRQLLRLIDRNPSLAANIKDLSYHEVDHHEMIPVEYSVREQNHDRRIVGQFSKELSLKSSTGNAFRYSLDPSIQPDILLVYDNMCSAILLSRLINLRKLSFSGYVGGKYALLLTPWARQIWEHMPIKSLEVLHWQSLGDGQIPQNMWWPVNDVGNHGSEVNEINSPNNDWNVISFLHFVPGIQQLRFMDHNFLARATPPNMPVLRFLTFIYIESVEPDETSQSIFELLQCSPVLKDLKITQWEPCKALQLKKALRHVRNSLEEIDIYGEIEDTSSTNGGIGPFFDFPSLRKMSIDVTSLVPSSSEDWPEDFSLLRLLPPNLESLHFYLSDGIFILFSTKAIDPDGLYESDRCLDLLRKLYHLLEEVALAKESGPLINLRTMKIEDEGWRIRTSRRAEADRGRVSEICGRLGIEWD